MNRRIRIPFLIDIAFIDEPKSLRAMNEEPRIDRAFARSGPLVNRLLQARLFRAMRVGGRLLPAFLPRDDRLRADAQAAVKRHLGQARRWAGADLQPLIAHVRGETGGDDLGIAVQQLVGRLFVDGYEATARSYAAARLIDAYPRVGPIRSLWWRISGKLDGARGLLARLAQGDAPAVHATSIALHNIVIAIDRLRDLYADRSRRTGLDVAAAVQQSLAAPPRLLRRVSAEVSLPDVDRPLREDGLVIFELKNAQKRTGAVDDVFLTGSWSACPAAAFVTALLTAVWQGAVDDGRTAHHRPEEAAA